MNRLSPLPRRQVLWLLLPLALPAAGGCGLFALARGEFEKPTFRIESTRVEFAQGRTRLSVGARIHNPNPYSLRVSTFTYGVRLLGELVGEGALEKAATVPARGEERVDLAIDLSLPRLLALALSGKLSGEVPYELKAVAEVAAAGIPRRFDLGDSGKVRLDLPLGGRPGGTSGS